MDDYECHGCSTCLNSADEVADGHCPACNLHKNGVVCTPVQAKRVAHMVPAHVATGEWVSLRTELRRNPTDDELLSRCTTVVQIGEEELDATDFGGTPLVMSICARFAVADAPKKGNRGPSYPVGKTLHYSRWATPQEIEAFKRNVAMDDSDNWPECPHCRTGFNHPRADYCSACGMPLTSERNSETKEKI